MSTYDAATMRPNPVSSEDDARKPCKEALQAFGRIDILINNAAVFVLKGLEATVEDWRRSLGVNIIGTSLVSRTVSEAMKRNDGGKGSGAIVNLGSMSSFIAQPHFVSYSATKAAIVQMTKNMAMELAPYNIRVNCVCPGTIITQATERHRTQLGISDGTVCGRGRAEASARPRRPPARSGLRDPVPGFGRRLVITGTHLMVDGGYTAQ